MRNRLLIKEEIKTALRKLIKEGITKKSDFQSVGLGGVNEPGDVEHILALFSDPKIGLSKEVEEIKKECSEKTDYKEIGECQKFHDFIGKYQSEKVFSSGFSDSRIDPDRETITNLYNAILGIDSKPGELTPEAKIEISGEVVPPKDWNTIVNLVIDNLEGGYYHPEMNLNGMGKSGETLFGIDRVNGGTINTTPEGIKFWNFVDENSGWSGKSEGKTKWKWGYMPNDSSLREYVSKMILTAYDADKKYAGMTSDMEELINSDARLQLHFAYGVWNGMGNFKKLYDSMVNYIKNNSNFTVKDLLENGINARRTLPGNRNIIAKSASKVNQLINSLS